jgi:hypothetical protein
LKHGVPPDSVEHLLFTFSGNDPSDHLETSLEGYDGEIGQLSVGLHVEEHGAFIDDVYERVIANVDDG